MPRRTSNLQLRGAVYWFRMRVPDALRTALGKTEITFSLNTRDNKEAQQKARLERVKIDAEWEALRRKLNPQPLAKATEIDVWRLVSRWFVEAEKHREQQPIDRDEEAYENACIDYDRLFHWEHSGHIFRRVAERLLKEDGFQAEDGEQFRDLQRGVQAGMIELERRDLVRMYPQQNLMADPKFSGLHASTVLKTTPSFTLSQVMDALKRDLAHDALTGKSLLKRDAHWRVLKEFFGPTTKMDDISRTRVGEFMELLKRLPSNASKHFSDKSLAVAAELGEQRSLPPMTADTANAYLRQLGSLFRYAVDEGMATTNPTLGKLFPKSKVRARDKRHPFKTADLKAIFSAPLYTGCVDDEHGYAKSGTNKPRRGRFWIPLISLFTGMRLGEVCQLTLDDIVHQDGTDIILIRGEDDETKRVKTEAGERFVPIHSELRRIGFLAYVEERRKASKPNARLFPELPAGTTGYSSDPFSKWFARFLDQLGVRDRKKVFHSFRHSFRDALREADVSIERVRALGGWTTGDSEETYGSDLRPSLLAQEIAKISYPGLDLSFLHLASQPSN